jgi:hypothetical protein
MQAGWLPPALLALVLAACGSEPAPDAVGDLAADEAAVAPTAEEAAERDALSRCGFVGPEGYCGIRFGMTREAAAAVFPVKLENYDTAPPSDIDPLRCYELFAVAPVTGVSLLVEGNAVGRIDFISSTARTSDGFGVGSPAAAIRTKFGSAVTEAPNVYEPEITDLSVVQGATKYIFEVENDAVRSWRVGVAPTIDYPAHCG